MAYLHKTYLPYFNIRTGLLEGGIVMPNTNNSHMFDSEIERPKPNILGIVGCLRFDSNMFQIDKAIRVIDRRTGAIDGLIMTYEPFRLFIHYYENGSTKCKSIYINDVISGDIKIYPMLPEDEHRWELVGDSWAKKEQ